MRWQDATISPTQNVHPFGRELVQLLWDENTLALLPDCGWFDGGCLILCSALHQWSQGVLQPSAWVRVIDGHLQCDHWAVWGQFDDVLLLFDGDGVGTELDFTAKMRLEGCADGELLTDCLRLFEAACAGRRPADEANLYPGNPVASLVRLLDRHIGSFSTQRIRLGWPDTDLSWTPHRGAPLRPHQK